MKIFCYLILNHLGVDTLNGRNNVMLYRNTMYRIHKAQKKYETNVVLDSSSIYEICSTCLIFILLNVETIYSLEINGLKMKRSLQQYAS